MELNLNKPRLDFIDAARGIAILMVIFGHLRFPFLSSWIYSCHVPVFFFLSGMLFSGYKFNFKDFFVKKIKVTVVPYFCLGFIIWVFFSLIYTFDKTPPDFVAVALDTPLNMAKDFLIQKHYWTVWFLACLFVAEIIFWCLTKLFREKQGALFLASTFIMIIAFCYYRLGGDTLPWNIDTAFIAQWFMCLGYLLPRIKMLSKFYDVINNSKVSLKKVAVTVMVLIVNVAFWIINIKLGNATLDMSVHLYGIEIFALISAVSGILFVISVAAALVNLTGLVYLGKNTMLVFALHSRVMIPVFNYLYLYLGIFQGEGFIEKAVYCIVTAIGILVVLLPIGHLISKTKLKVILGK